MKIKCAYCDQKTIAITDIFKSYVITCPSCSTELLYDLDSKKFNKLIFLFLSLLVVIGIFLKPSNLQLWIALILIFIALFLGSYFISLTKIKPDDYSPPPIAIKHSFIVIILLFTYVSMVLLIKNLHVQFMLGILGWFLLAYLIYVFKKASKHK
jgi:hypothetical protein